MRLGSDVCDGFRLLVALVLVVKILTARDVHALCMPSYHALLHHQRVDARWLVALVD